MKMPPKELRAKSSHADTTTRINHPEGRETHLVAWFALM